MLLRHSALYLLARGVPGVLNVIAVLVYTRFLAPEQYGHFALVIAAVAFGHGAFFSWLQMGLARLLPGSDWPVPVFLSTLLAGYGLALPLATLLTLAAWLWLPLEQDQQLAWLVLPVLCIWALFEIHQQLQAASFRPRRFGLLALSKSLVGLALGTSLAWMGLGAWGVLLGFMLGMLLPLTAFAWRDWRDVRPALVDRALLRRLLDYGMPLAATSALALWVDGGDRLLLGWLQGADQAGLYAVGHDLPSYGVAMLMVIIYLAAYPLVVQALERQGPAAAAVQLRGYLVLLLVVAVPAVVLCVLLAPGIADLLLGAEFRRAGSEIIPWIAVAALLFGLKNFYLDLAFQLGHGTQRQLLVMLVVAGANLALNLSWIPDQGYLGAAHAKVSSYALGVVLSMGLGRKWFPLPIPWMDIGKIFGAAVGMGWVLWLMGDVRGIWALGLATGASLACYGGLLWVIDLAGARARLRDLLARDWNHFRAR